MTSIVFIQFLSKSFGERLRCPVRMKWLRKRIFIIFKFKISYISVGGVGLRCLAKPVIATGELDLEFERVSRVSRLSRTSRLTDGDRERIRRGDSELERLRRCLDVLLFGELDLERPLLISSLDSSSGDSLRNLRLTGLLTPFLPEFSDLFSSAISIGDGGGEASLRPCSISSSFFFLAAALFL